MTFKQIPHWQVGWSPGGREGQIHLSLLFTWSWQWCARVIHCVSSHKPFQSESCKIFSSRVVTWSSQSHKDFCHFFKLESNDIKNIPYVCSYSLNRGSQPGLHVPPGVHSRLSIEKQNIFAHNLFPNTCTYISEYSFQKSLYAYTLRAGLIQAVRKKQLFRTWLCGWISPLLFALATRRKSQKTWSV